MKRCAVHTGNVCRYPTKVLCAYTERMRNWAMRTAGRAGEGGFFVWFVLGLSRALRRIRTLTSKLVVTIMVTTDGEAIEADQYPLFHSRAHLIPDCRQPAGLYRRLYGGQREYESRCHPENFGNVKKSRAGRCPSGSGRGFPAEGSRPDYASRHLSRRERDGREPVVSHSRQAQFELPGGAEYRGGSSSRIERRPIRHGAKAGTNDAGPSHRKVQVKAPFYNYKNYN